MQNEKTTSFTGFSGFFVRIELEKGLVQVLQQRLYGNP